MTNNFDAEAAKKIINTDNPNVTVPNPIKELFKIISGIILGICCIYLITFFLSGILLQSLSSDKQADIENFISPKLKLVLVEITEKEQNRLNNIRDEIIKTDSTFTRTSNLEVRVIKHRQLNAICYPNGNIYITSALYNKLKNDEQLTFVIAHEIAHYKHKDHLLNLRRQISNNAVLIFLSVLSPNNRELHKITNDSLKITDLKYSRNLEAKADKYAVKIMNQLYGNSKEALFVMELLRAKNKHDFEFMSSHPNINKRMDYIRKFSYQ